MTNYVCMYVWWLHVFKKEEAENESGFKNPSRQICEKKEVKVPKNSVFGHFWKIVELNTDMVEPSLFSEIDNWSLLFKMNPKPNWLDARLK